MGLVGAALGDTIVPPQHSCELATVFGTENHFLDSTGSSTGRTATLTETIDDGALSQA